jgi:4-diphosphocytidyl-2-C-methyl-D-erythritol kinase
MRARAKINLSLHVLGRREDGYHELESLVAFAGAGDELSLMAGDRLSLTISGPMGEGLLYPSPRRKRGEWEAPMVVNDDNLVLRAALNLAALVPGLRLGAFHLVKRLPVASGIGGGSADAAAALRLLAQANGMARDDSRLFEAARATGADVPACLISRSLIMRGAGETLERISPPQLFAVLVNPGVAVPTAAVFGELGLGRGEALPLRQPASVEGRPIAASWSGLSRPSTSSGPFKKDVDGRDKPDHDGEGVADGAAFLARLATLRNDLEPPAIRIAPVIGEVLGALRNQAGCRLARMSGSGATCFAIFDDCRASAAAGKRIARAHPGWWVKPTALG